MKRWTAKDVTANPMSLHLDQGEGLLLFEPFEDDRGGDFFLIEQQADAVLFAVADAAGHGHAASLFWQQFEAVFLQLWQDYIVGGVKDPIGSIERFARDANRHLFETEAPHLISTDLCLALGYWHKDGRVDYANFGYGTHVLMLAESGPCWAASEALFGLKLGWISDTQRQNLPRRFTPRSLDKVERMMLMTDGLLGDDFQDPEATMASLQRLEQQLSGSLESMLEKARGLDSGDPHDDVTVIALSR